MPSSDQPLRSKNDSSHFGRPEIAAEFLRRNQRFRNDQASLARRVTAGEISAEDAHAELARRWGISFRP
ncbi:MAG: hypothetical protein E2598_07870 [Sphingobium sp.]|nr:hypothetical protein [Sphingobium sp.]